jgi:hypothetical protein
MPLLKAEAEKLSENDLVRGVIEEVIEKDDLFAILPFTRTEGKAYVYNRETTVVEADFLDPNEEVQEGAATFAEVVTKLRILAHDVDVDKFLASSMSDANDQVAVQLAAKAKGLARKFRRTLVIGDNTANPKEFDGIGKLVSPSQSIALDGALSLSALDELADSIPNGADVFLMRSGTVRAFRALLRAAGGTVPESIMVENFGRPMLAHNGIVILVNDYIPALGAVGSEKCDVWALRLNEDDGLHGLFGGQTGAGMAVEAIGTVQNKDAWRYRVKWYAGLALKSTKSLARLTGVTNV